MYRIENLSIGVLKMAVIDDFRTIRIRNETYERIVERKRGRDTISDVIDRAIEASIPREQKTLSEL